MSPILIVKSTGEQEAFDPQKLVNSLRKAGATRDQAESVLLHIQKELREGMSSAEIYKHAFAVLRSIARPIAARYSMKRAIADLGPQGFPFEKFIAEIFKAAGYDAVTDQVVQGHCVAHEIDVVAWKGDELVMVEAKFHNESGIKSDLKVALYVKARWDDLRTETFEFGGRRRSVTSFQLFTNTKFSEAAIEYAKCQGLTLVGWRYPSQGNLEDLIEESGLHPITTLTTLSETEKKTLLDAGIVLCKQAAANPERLAALGVARDKLDQVVAEAERIAA